MAKQQPTNNVSRMIKTFCKFLINKLPSINWKTTQSQDEVDDKFESSCSSTSSSRNTSPIKRTTINSPSNQLNRNQLKNQSDQPDVVPMVHLIIPVRQRCHSTTTDC